MFVYLPRWVETVILTRNCQVATNGAPKQNYSKLYHFQARPRAVSVNFGLGMRKFTYPRKEYESTSKHQRQIESTCLVLMVLNNFRRVQYSQRPVELLQKRTRCFQKFRIEENAATHRQRDAFVMSLVCF